MNEDYSFFYKNKQQRDKELLFDKLKPDHILLTHFSGGTTDKLLISCHKS